MRYRVLKETAWLKVYELDMEDKVFGPYITATIRTSSSCNRWCISKPVNRFPTISPVMLIADQAKPKSHACGETLSLPQFVKFTLN